MAFPLTPRQVLNSIYDLNPAALRERGIRLVLCDLDNTLAPYEEPLPSPALLAWKQALEAQGLTLFVVSNSRKKRRCPDFCAALGVGCVRHAGKPKRGGFARALQENHARPQEAVMVGDQIFTDIWGANRAGIFSILVKPIAIGRNPLRALRYWLETPFRWAGKKRGDNL